MAKKTQKTTYIVGVDEAGRGPVAGPVAVGVFMIKASDLKAFQKKGLFESLRDSKKLSEKKRNEWLVWIKEMQSKEKCTYAVGYGSAAMIDSKGIEYAVRRAMKKAFDTIGVPVANTHVLLDGRLHAPEEFSQETIIKGDEKEPAISLASICAKVMRDKKVCQFAKKYPEYKFELHKGYGTKAHYDALKKHGVCKEHRISFLSRL